MDAVVLALASAALFGSMTVALRFALARVPDAEAGALWTIVAALAVTLPFVAAGEIDLAGTWPFLLAGVLGPGCSQLLFTLADPGRGPVAHVGDGRHRAALLRRDRARPARRAGEGRGDRAARS